MAETFYLAYEKGSYDESEKGHPKSPTAVIVPTHNRPKLLSECLKALVRQDIGGYQVIIVDDGSNAAKFREIHRAVQGIRPRYGVSIKLYRSRVNRGPGEARARGIEEALVSGSRILIEVDDDDLVAPECIRRMSETLEEYDAVYTNHKALSLCNKNEVVEIAKPPYEPGIFRYGNYAYGVRGYKSKVWDLIKDGESEFAEDYELFIKLDVGGARIALIPEMLATIRINPDGRSIKDYIEVVRSSTELVRKYYGGFGEEGDQSRHS